MRFFLYNNAQTPGPDEDDRIIAAVIEQSLWADRHGFAGIAITEHHFDNYNTWGNAFMLASYLAPQLEQATLILAVSVPAMQNPVEFAERANLLDQLTKGRAIIGVGPGGSPVEYAGVGRDAEHRYEVLEQSMQIAQRAWALEQDTEPLEYETRWDAGRIVGRIMPRPYGGRATPRLARATLSDDGFLWAAKRGWPVFFGRYDTPTVAAKLSFFDRALRDAGHDEATIAEAKKWTFVQKMIYVAPSDEEAMDDLVEPIAFYQSLLPRAFPRPDGPVGEGFDVRKAVGAVAGDAKEFLDASAIYGSPETVIAGLRDLAATGLENVACFMYFGNLPEDKVRRSMELFAAEVMPHVG